MTQETTARTRQPLDPDELLARATHGVAQAEAMGADQAEVYLWQGHTTEVLQGGRLRMAQGSDKSGVGARVLLDGSRAFAKTSGISPEDIRWATQRALGSARHVPADPVFDRFPDPRPVDRSPRPVHPALAEPEMDRLVAMAETLRSRAEQEAAANYLEIRLQVDHGRFAVANSRGVEAWDNSGHEQLFFEVRCGQGDVQRFSRGVRFGPGPLDEAHDLEALADQVVAEALAARHGKPLPHTTDQVILDAACATHVLHRILPSFIGKAALDGRTTLADRLGEQVFHEQLTLWDDPLSEAGCRRQRVDDEGVPTQRTPLVENGVLEGYLFDWMGHLETAEPPTGHGLRPIGGRYTSQPGAKVCNLELTPGDATLDEMVAEAEEAVLVRGTLMGAFTLDHLSGDFSVVAPLAFHVKHGQVQDALVSTTLGGNLFDALRDARALGSEIQRFVQGASIPLWLEGVTCAT